MVLNFTIHLIPLNNFMIWGTAYLHFWLNCYKLGNIGRQEKFVMGSRIPYGPCQGVHFKEYYFWNPMHEFPRAVLSGASTYALFSMIHCQYNVNIHMKHFDRKKYMKCLCLKDNQLETVALFTLEVFTVWNQQFVVGLSYSTTLWYLHCFAHFIYHKNLIAASHHRLSAQSLSRMSPLMQSSF